MRTRTEAAATSGGMGTCSVLTTVFIVLKLVDVIDWSWWWVLSPTLIPIGLVVTIIAVVTTFTMLKHFTRKKGKYDC